MLAVVRRGGSGWMWGIWSSMRHWILFIKAAARVFARAVSATGGNGCCGVGRVLGARVRAVPGGWEWAWREGIVALVGRVVGSTAPRSAAAGGGSSGARGFPLEDCGCALRM